MFLEVEKNESERKNLSLPWTKWRIKQKEGCAAATGVPKWHNAHDFKTNGLINNINWRAEKNNYVKEKIKEQNNRKNRNLKSPTMVKEGCAATTRGSIVAQRSWF